MNEIRGYDSLRPLPKPKPAQRFGWLCELPKDKLLGISLRLRAFALNKKSASLRPLR